MSKKIQVAEAIEVLANQYRAMVEAAELLKQIGSLEQAVGEATKANEAARENQKIAEEELAALKVEAKKAKAKGEDILAAATAKANENLESADLEAKAIVVAANEEAELILAHAKQSGEAYNADIVAVRDKLTKGVKDMSAKLDELQASYAAKLEQVDAVESRLEKAQAQIAKLLG